MTPTTELEALINKVLDEREAQRIADEKRTKEEKEIKWWADHKSYCEKGMWFSFVLWGIYLPLVQFSMMWFAFDIIAQFWYLSLLIFVPIWIFSIRAGLRAFRKARKIRKMSMDEWLKVENKDIYL